jgi:hypothetical protein
MSLLKLTISIDTESLVHKDEFELHQSQIIASVILLYFFTPNFKGRRFGSQMIIPQSCKLENCSCCHDFTFAAPKRGSIPTGTLTGIRRAWCTAEYDSGKGFTKALFSRRNCVLRI